MERLATGMIGRIGCAVLASCAIAMLSGAGAGAAASRTLSVPGRSNANVSIAADGNFVAAVWSASTETGTTDIYAAVSRDAGRTFTPPSRVNSQPGAASVNGEQPPRVALVPRAGGAPEIVVIWTAKGAAGTRLLTARSEDSGRTFSSSTAVPGTDAPGNRGWQAIGADDEGHMYAVWLDHRQLAAKEPQVSAGHQHGRGHTRSPASHDGLAMAQLSQLYVAPLDAASPRAVTGGVCYCCKTAIAAGGRGTLYLAWRHVYAGNLRDIAFTSSVDGGRTFGAPGRVSEDQWAIDGCPDDGPAMAVDPQGRVHVVWPTVITERGEPVKALFHAMSRDGRTFTERDRIPTVGHAHHPQLAIGPDGSLAVVWDESGSGTREIALARGTTAAHDRVRFRRERLSDAGSGVYPAIVATRGGLLIAWTSGPPDGSLVQIRHLLSNMR